MNINTNNINNTSKKHEQFQIHEVLNTGYEDFSTNKYERVKISADEIDALEDHLDSIKEQKSRLEKNKAIISAYKNMCSPKTNNDTKQHISFRV